MSARQPLNVLSDISGVVAIRHIVHTSSGVVKGIWLLILLLSVSLCSAMIFQLLTDYMERSIISVQDLQTPNKLEFPTITLCFYLRANQSAVKKYNYSREQMTYLFAAYDGSYDSYPSYAQNQLDELQNSLADETRDIYSFFLEKVGIKCDHVLKQCSFQGFQFNCCSGAMIFLSEIGVCVTLHVPRQYQSIPGRKGGLKIGFEIYEEAYPEAYYYNYPNEGLALHVTDPTSTENLTRNPVLISSKRYVMIQLKKSLTKLYSDGSCVEVGSPNGQNRLKYFDTYTQSACVNECIMNATIDQCHCALIGSVDSADHIPLCTPHRAITCTHPARQKILETFSVDNCSCLLPCTYTDYSSQFGMMKVPSTGYFDAMCSELNIDEGWADKRLDTAATVEIYFSDFMFWTTHLHPRFSVPEFISLLGSQLSLWVGVRMVTVFEIIYVCTKMFNRTTDTTKIRPIT